MKKVFLMLMAVLTFGSAIVSCSDKETDPITPENPSTPETPVTPTPAETADYTIIFWGMAGSQDGATVFDLATLADHYQKGNIGKNVQIAGLLKTSLSKVDGGGMVEPSYDKTWYFDSKEIGTAETFGDSDFADMWTADGMKSLYKKALDTMGGKVYGDTLYPLNNVDSLAGFIKKTAEKFPARHYVLMVYGHGNGFSPVDDTPVSRACVSDDFMNNSISADALVSAVQKSGVKIQTLFTQCCLMGTLENIAAYSQVFDYGILAAETTTGYYFPQYLVNLSQAGDDEAKMQEMSRKLVDFYVEEAAPAGFATYTSHGFYNLTKASALISATKEASDWFATNYAIADQQDAIERALASSIVSINLEYGNQKMTDSLRQVRQELQDVISGKKSFSTEREFHDFLKGTLYLIVLGSSKPTGFCMSDVMRNAIAANLPEEKTAALKTIYEKYMTALKDMAYIRTTDKPAKADADYEYIYASPTVNIFSLNPDYFIKFPVQDGEFETLYAQLLQAVANEDDAAVEEIGHKMLEGNIYAHLSDLSTVKKNYTSSVFDQQVGWSKFLEMLHLTPSLAFCPDRWQVNQSMK